MSTSRFLTLALSVLILSPAFSQNYALKANGSLQANPSAVNKSTSPCGNDTLEYTLSKATDVEWQPMNLSVNYAQIAQKYEAPQAITVHGACFYAKTATSAAGPASLDVQMYSTDSVGLPGTLMSTVSTSAPLLPADPFENTRMCVSFTTPITTSEDYFIVIDGRGTTLPLSLARNSDIFDDGASEGLSAVFYEDGSGAAYVKWYDQRFDPLFTLATDPLGWNYDYLLDPIVSYDLVLNASITGVDTACSSATICVETDSVSPIFSHRMYATNTNTSTLTDWGDGTSTVADSACHDYNMPGQYFISQSMVMNGWNILCTPEEKDSLFIFDTIFANFSYSISQDTVEFINTSTDSTQAQWDFGSAGTSTAFDVTVIFPTNGSYDVQLITTSDNGCSDTITQTVFVTVGIDEEKELQLSMYPNPSNGNLFINNVQNKNVKVAIMEMTGKLVHSAQVEMGQNTIGIAHLAPGHYLVKFSTSNAVRVEKLLLVQ